MKRLASLAVVAVALSACDGGSGGPAQPPDDPVRGIYNYEHAREAGIRVDPVPPDDELCPTGVEDDGLSSEEMDTPEERQAIEREMATAPTCIVDPRLAVIVLGYSVEAVRNAPSAFEKGKLICGGIAPSIPGVGNRHDLDLLARRRLRNAYGVDASDTLDELVAGCRATTWGASMLFPD
jgi:hypothetical protein